MHQYLGAVYPKPKTFKLIYNKKAKQIRIPDIFREHNIYLFHSNKHAVAKKFARSKYLRR